MSADDSQGGLMNKGWEEVQKKTFTKWVNSQIKSRGLSISDVSSKEMSNGIILAALLSSISGEYVAVTQKCNLRIQQTENISVCLKFIQSKNVNLQNIGPADIVDANPKLLLGMIWTIILRFTITDINNEGKTAREGLLLWCRRCVENYGIQIDNFTSSWHDGRAYAALLHSQSPSSINYEQCLKKTPQERIKETFDAAERDYAIAQLLDVEDVPTVDEKSNMTNIAQYFHAFSEKSNVQRAQRRAKKFSNSVKAVTEMRNDYEKRTKALLERFVATSNGWTSVMLPNDYRGIQSERNKHRQWKSSDKRAMISEKGNLVTMYSNIQTKAKTFGFKPYTAPAGLTVADTAKAFSAFQVCEADHLQKMKSKSREIKDNLQRNFAAKADGFSETLQEISKKLAELSGDLEKQESGAKCLQKEHSKAESMLPELENMWNECLEAGVDDNDEINHTYDDLHYDAEILKAALTEKIDFVANQSALSKMSNVTDAQIEMYKDTFKVFAKENPKSLRLVECKAALASLGINATDEQIDSYLERPKDDSTEPKGMPVYKFIQFVQGMEEDKTTPTQLTEAFRTIAGGKDYITVGMMETAGYEADTIAILIKDMTPAKGCDGEEAYDYKSYISNTLAA